MLSLDKSRNYGKHYTILPIIVRELHVHIMAEIGVHSGRLTNAILGSCPGVTEYLMIDPWLLPKCKRVYASAIYARAKIVHQRYRKRAQLIRSTSLDAVDRFEDGSLDFVYIDGNHSHEHVLQDITIWWPKIRSGGSMGGHDLDSQHGHGVRSAILEADVFDGLALQCGMPPSNWHGVWIVHKP